ncbi:hypothetical protein C8F04DRAFT_1182421 [Mycena alexandri]|uniref:Uncharacterized protein n=1 Tax=Mycena alexandri TaxID=1745969 RepID=A0AAD6SWC1_9AGAR|nr:hypothetical protein C8F04DRAFT_1182421 [Mycena alexandri]
MVKSLLSAQGLALLPVLYIHLNPSLISTLDELDDSMDFYETSSDRLRCEGTSSWPWISFVNTYWLQLPGFVTAEQSLHRVPAPVPVVALILKLLTDRAARDIIYATPVL